MPLSLVDAGLSVWLDRSFVPVAMFFGLVARSLLNRAISVFDISDTHSAIWVLAATTVTLMLEREVHDQCARHVRSDTITDLE